MGKYFGTDGFRGEANVDLTVEHAYKVGRYLGWYYGRDHKAKIVIGKDTRRSSYMFEYALVSGLTASGADAYLLHVTTTPSVSYIVRTDGFDCGIMISASHNPFYDNGLKVIDSKGQKLNAEVENAIEKYIDGLMDEIPFAVKENIGRTVDYSMGRNRYIGYLMSIPTRAFKDLKVGLDCANGSASSIAKAVFDALGAKTYVINNEPDGTNINTNCGSTHIEALQSFVTANALDVGFAYDGDADRCLAVDEFGRLVDGDLILYVCGKELKQRGELNNNKIVTTIMSNIGLYKALDEIGIGYAKTQVGDKYVYENMVEENNVIGGEQSGHIIFSKHATTGDGILTSLKIVETMIENKKTLAQLTEPVKIYPQLLINVRVKDKKVVLDDPDVAQAVEDVAKALEGDGRALVRPSGTEPVIRVMVEAPTDELCHEHVLKVVNKIKEKGYAVD
ncbi:phosphoglucosamine mutase [Kandleria vitulina]|jgi:phosphoglucosamine mutase|uniref:Phosphoglucosamine mutase n=1 Tax=Kandleria vitulina TaxID=1630 RepID=A0A1H2SUF7_9FIRM|nr:phosphoglucosamine mutase [Kandleria vitulina]MEE0989598.1 phosphoglucosamine mutase [Kandleria vitulina]SDW34669.1 phosphoglucosamine mutase [Kandleria vitulina]HAD23049.1 phosphoglucosamine mutase [Kandleria vitulina]HAH74725.1 phosphoglucosamine mutase [Kandleria vitulina]HBG67948.1 phosphoglucosamine mutase [Kandleria vitulina]